MKHTYPHILVYDSGFGGLTIAQEIIATIGDCDISYVADNAKFPYGSKAPSELKQRTLQLLDKQLAHLNPDITIIACNTASTLALDDLRQTFGGTFVGVVPAIKPAAQLSKTKVIGVLGTTGTIEREYTRKLVHDFAQHCEVHLHASPKLVLCAENKLLNTQTDQETLKSELTSLLQRDKSNRMDCIVLACTHFPLLKCELSAASPRTITWVDSGSAVAKHTQSLIKRKGLMSNNIQQRALASKNFFRIIPTRAFVDPTSVKHNISILMPLLHHIEIVGKY